MKQIFIAISLLLLFNNIQAQEVPSFLNEELIRAELDSRGFKDISIEEMRERLTLKGIDAENLNPSQTEELQEAFDQIYIDLQKEKEEAKEPTKEEKEKEEAKEEKEKEADEKEDDALNEQIKDDAFELDEADREKLVYGQGLFLDKDIKNYFKHSNVKPPASYLLGEGDEIIVNIFGKAQLSNNYEINNGYIQPSKMERIFLKGLTFGQAKKIISQRFSQYYRFQPDEISIALNFSRNISINIVGEVRSQGNYTIPALNSVFSALIVAKGPNMNGTVRNIKVIGSNSGKMENFDLYEYLLEPTGKKDYFLQNNDFLSVPSIGKVVSIDGAVRRKHKYELKENENLKKLIYWAGGLKSNAYKKSIRIIRYENGEEIIKNIDYSALEKNGGDFKLMDGDQIDIPFIPVNYENFVSIEGAVDIEGQFEYTKGMRASDLIKKGVLKDSARVDLAYLFRKRADSREDFIKINLSEVMKSPGSESDLLLSPKDRINIFYNDEFLDKSYIKIEGAVRQPNTYPHSEGRKLTDLIILSGGLKEDATGLAFIFRENPDSYEQSEYLRINVKEIIEDPTKDISLEPKDRVVIYSYSDFIESDAVVSISGAVLQDNEYPYATGMKLRELLELSGGLKISADNSKVMIYRINLESGVQTKTEEIELEIDEEFNVIGEASGDFLLEPYDKVIVRYTPDFELQQNVVIEGEVRYPGSYSIIKPNEKISDIIRRAGGYKNSAFKEGVTLFRNEGGLGYLVIDQIDILNNSNSNSNYILKKGDVITIPKEVNVVSIQGFTNAEEEVAGIELSGGKINVPFVEGKDAKYYIDKYAGGINKDAGAKNRLIKVKQPGGSLEKTKDYGFFKRYPKVQKGAVIIVDRIVKSEKEREREKVDWGEVISNTVGQATAILTLVILIQQIQ